MNLLNIDLETVKLDYLGELFCDKETGKMISSLPELKQVVNYYHLGLKRGDKLPENHVYIGRKNYNPVLKDLPESIFHNPFPVKKCENKKERIYARINSVLSFKCELWRKLMTGTISKEQLLNLLDKTLVCFCGDNLCHGHIIKMTAHYVKNNEKEFDELKERYQKKHNIVKTK